MPNNDADVHDALARLQDNPKPANTTGLLWLDAHKDDMITLCQSKGIQMACELLAISPSIIYNWRSVRGLAFKCPRLSRNGRFALAETTGGPPRLIPREAPVRSEPVEPPPPETPEYVRGQRDAYRHALALVAPAVELLSHK